MVGCRSHNRTERVADLSGEHRRMPAQVCACCRGRTFTTPAPAPPAGTPAYMAPELLSGGAYCAKVDMYAAGVMINEMLTHQVGLAAAAVDVDAACGCCCCLAYGRVMTSCKVCSTACTPSERSTAAAALSPKCPREARAAHSSAAAASCCASHMDNKDTRCATDMFCCGPRCPSPAAAWRRSSRRC